MYIYIYIIYTYYIYIYMIQTDSRNPRSFKVLHPIAMIPRPWLATPPSHPAPPPTRTP